MVRCIAPLLGALVLSTLAGAAPAPGRKRDSAVGDEVAVSAPDGVVESDTAELSSQLASETTSFADDTTTADAASATIDPAAIPTDTAPLDGTDGVDSAGDIVAATETSIAPPAIATTLPSYGGYNFPMYGSGSWSWMPSYSTCITQCFVQYPPPPTTLSIPSSGYIGSGVVDMGSSSFGSSDSIPPTVDSGSVAGSSSGSGSGTVHSVVVSSSDHTLRFTPFYVVAQPGDTVVYNWAAGPHTVTQSSASTPCNGSIGGFASGMQQAGATFSVLVNDTNPVFFYCGVPTHCQKGMFGVINPTMGGANATVGDMMDLWASADADIGAVYNQTLALASSASGPSAKAGATWGNQLNVADIPPNLHASVAKNILYSRLVMLANPSAFNANGTFTPKGNTLSMPYDVSGALDAANAGGAPSSAAATAAPTGAAAPAGASNGAALSVRSSGVAVAAVAVLAALLAF